MQQIQTVGVVGGGTMGNGIAHVAARQGFRVILHDLEYRFLDRAISTIEKNLDREVAKGKISADDKQIVLARITRSVKADALAETDFAIEAVVEDFETKSKLFRMIDEIA